MANTTRNRDLYDVKFYWNDPVGSIRLAQVLPEDLTLNFLVHYLSLSKPTIYRLRATKGFPNPSGPNSRVVYYSKTEVLIWLLKECGVIGQLENTYTDKEHNIYLSLKVLVLDAQYRARKLKMTSSYTNTGLPDYPKLNNTNNTPIIHGTSSSTSPSACASLTDATLNSLWVDSIDANTSKHNTDVWLTQADCECATHCRSIKVNGVGCDIPNLQTLMRIFCEGVLLDELDPTVSSYPDLKLSDWFNSWKLWSSTEYSTYAIRQMYSNGEHSNDMKDISQGVCPVLELS